LSWVAQFSQRSILLGGPTSPLSTRTDFRSRLDRGFTIATRATCIRRAATFSPPSSKGCSSGGHILFLLLVVLSRSYQSILWWIFSPLGTLFLSAFVIYVLAVFALRLCTHAELFLLSWGSVQGVSWGLFLSKLVIFVFQYSPTLHIRDFHVRYYRTPSFS
jgi:hypothetical protein